MGGREGRKLLSTGWHRKALSHPPVVTLHHHLQAWWPQFETFLGSCIQRMGTLWAIGGLTNESSASELLCLSNGLVTARLMLC